MNIIAPTTAPASTNTTVIITAAITPPLLELPFFVAEIKTDHSYNRIIYYSASAISVRH